jgi:hypothetical protein
MNITTVQNSSTIEQNEIKEYNRNTPFNVPPQKVTTIKLVATRGTIRVPFHAFWKINGRATVRIYLKVCVFGKEEIQRGEPDITINIAELLSDAERTFNFDGYVTNENSSDLTISYAERPISSGECEMKEIASTSQSEVGKLQSQILKGSKLKYSSVDLEPKKIPIPEAENLKYKILYSTIPSKKNTKAKSTYKH